MTDPSILTAEEIASVRRDYRGASLLPKRVYHDLAIHEWERANILRRDWVMVAREEDVPDPGTYMLVELDDDPLMIVRDRQGVLRAFHNVCRHRGTAVAEEPCGKVVRFQCPYHAWIYDLDGSLMRAKHTEDLVDFSLEGFGLAGVRLETWQGFIFLNLDPDASPLTVQLGDLVERWSRFDFASLRSAKHVEYDVAANWKFIAENYSECYHCPGLHPHLNHLTPYDLGEEHDPDGCWLGGFMELADGVETMALDGGQGSRGGRPAMAGMTALDERRIDYYILWPMSFLSVHPDYLLVHRMIPQGPARTIVTCDWLFEPATMAMPEFDPSDAVAFWDLTNTQDWHVCELQQRGTRSSSWVAGRYSNQEFPVHNFDRMVVDRYVGDPFLTTRARREAGQAVTAGGFKDRANGHAAADRAADGGATNGSADSGAADGGAANGGARKAARSRATALR